VIVLVHLEKIDHKNCYECFKLSVFESQRNFVAANITSLAEAYVRRDLVEPYAIYNDETMVGFVMIIPDDDDLQSMYIWRFMVDQKYQGQGFGKQTLKLIIEMVESRHAFTAIKLSFEPENSHAKNLYESLGFVLTGRILEGEAEMELKLASGK